MKKNDMKDQHSIVVVGKLGAAYGIKGWLKLHSFTEVSEDIFKYNAFSSFYAIFQKSNNLQLIDRCVILYLKGFNKKEVIVCRLPNQGPC